MEPRKALDVADIVLYGISLLLSIAMLVVLRPSNNSQGWLSHTYKRSAYFMLTGLCVLRISEGTLVHRHLAPAN
jgi:hypothetical protein